MSEELEIEYQIEDIDGLVTTDFAAHEEVGPEVVEEVVINNDSQDIYDDEEIDDDIEDDILDNSVDDNIDDNVDDTQDDNPDNIDNTVDDNSGHNEDKVGDDEVYQWSAFTGLRVKTFTSEELALFRKPFELGWKREVVLRGTVTSSGKKIGDVYYFSPDKKTKLRSYVEMGLYLKRSGSTLQPENFTFARQPIYRPPLEIVRHAMQRGQHQPIIEPFKEESPAQVSRSARTSTASESEEQFAMSIAEGRAKRKRVAPTRFEDENYEESPFKKKPIKIGSNGSQLTTNVVNNSCVVKSAQQQQQTQQQKQQLSLQEKRRQLQHQLYQQVHEKTLKQKEEQEKQQTSEQNSTQNGINEVVVNEEPDKEQENKEISITKIDANGKQVILPLNARKSISQTKVKTEEELKDTTDKSDQEAVQNQEAGAPCSMHCPGRRGMLPNLMCSRCFCLYHLDCVPGGVFLEEPRVFVCPNCLTPEDTQKSKETKVNGHVEEEIPKVLVTTSTPVLIPVQQKPRSTFAPILPKPPQLQPTLQIFQKSQPVIPPKRLPIGTHLYRVATGPNGHSMIVKDRTIKPKMRRKPAQTGSQLPVYKPAPIAPIGPIKLTPQQIQKQLRQILEPMKRRGYSRYMEKSAVQSLVSPYLCLNQVLDCFSVLSYLTVTDLVRLRQVSRVWNQLSSQPFLWRNVKLKGIAINDWQYLAKNIIECFQSVTVDFEGVKSTNQDVCEFWRNFQTIVDYLKSVRCLRFGSIPTFVLEEIAAAAVTDNPYNSFSVLEELSVKNLFEEESDECHLSFLADFNALQSLKRLSINCKIGFKPDINTIELLTQVFKQMPSLQTLVLTSLKDFSSDQFVFLTSLTQLEHLEIGSCLNWFDETSIGAFKYLSGLTQLKRLRLVDITLHDCSQSLTQTLEALKSLKSLTIDNLKIEASGMEVLDQLCSVLRSHPMDTFSISTDDSNTNKCVFDLLKKLDNCSKLFWKVGALVEDSGECFVPFRRDMEESEEENEIDSDVKYMDLTFLNEVIQSELSHAIIEIIPQ